MTQRESLIEKLKDSEARFRSLTALSSDWYWEMDASLRFTRLEIGSGSQPGNPGEDIIGRYRWELPAEIVQPATWDEHKALLLNRQPFRDLVLRRRLADGKPVYHTTSGDPVFGADGEFRGYRGVGKDITQQVRAQERIERLATIDPLTQLPNRQTFDERAGRLLENAYAGGRTCWGGAAVMS